MQGQGFDIVGIERCRPGVGFASTLGIRQAGNCAEVAIGCGGFPVGWWGSPLLLLGDHAKQHFRVGHLVRLQSIQRTTPQLIAGASGCVNHRPNERLLPLRRGLCLARGQQCVDNGLGFCEVHVGLDKISFTNDRDPTALFKTAWR